MLNRLKVRAENIGVALDFDEYAERLIAKEGGDSHNGARPIRRAVTRIVENPFSEEILEGKIRSGDKICVSAENDKIIFKKKGAN